MSELKLEVGKVYLDGYRNKIKIIYKRIEHECAYPFIGINLGEFDEPSHYNEIGYSVIYEDSIKNNLIKEHKEPYKATRVFYTAYDPAGESYPEESSTDEITGLTTIQFRFYNLEELKEAQREEPNFCKTAKITVITEEIE